MSLRDTVRDWLLLVGQEYQVREAHHYRRVDDKNKRKRKHFVYWFDTSGDELKAGRSMDCSTSSGYDKNVVLIRPYMRTLVVQCIDDEDGMRVLESVMISSEHPDVQKILNAGSDGHNGTDDNSRMVVVSFDSINNLTEFDDTEIEFKYELRMQVRIHSSFTRTFEDGLVEDLTLTGKIIDPDDNDLPIEVEDTITIP